MIKRCRKMISSLIPFFIGSSTLFLFFDGIVAFFLVSLCTITTFTLSKLSSDYFNFLFFEQQKIENLYNIHKLLQIYHIRKRKYLDELSESHHHLDERIRMILAERALEETRYWESLSKIWKEFK